MPRTRTTLAEDLAAARAAAPELAERAAVLVSAVKDSAAKSALPGWSAGDVAVHLAVACGGYSSAAAGTLGDLAGLLPDSPDVVERLAGLNATMIAKAGPDAHLAVPGQLRDAAAVLVAALEDRDPAEPVAIPWFGAEAPMTLASVAGLFLSELVIHTLDVARASGQKWTIPPEIARLIISLAYLDAMPRIVDTARAAKVHAAVRLHVRGGVTIGLDIAGAQVETHRDPAPGRADCHVWLDPVAFVLTVSGRSSQVRQMAAGRMLAYGRKPWLGPVIARLFPYP